MVQWGQRWYRMKKAYPLAENKAQLLVCTRACLFSVYTWLALAYVPHLITNHLYLMALSVSITVKANGAPSVAYLAEAGGECLRELICVLFRLDYSVPLVAFLVFATQKVSHEVEMV